MGPQILTQFWSQSDFFSGNHNNSPTLLSYYLTASGRVVAQIDKWPQQHQIDKCTYTSTVYRVYLQQAQTSTVYRVYLQQAQTSTVYRVYLQQAQGLYIWQAVGLYVWQAVGLYI